MVPWGKPKRPDLATLNELKASKEKFALKGKIFYLHAMFAVYILEARTWVPSASLFSERENGGASRDRT